MVFAAYPLAPHVDGCPHCVLEADHSALHSVKLRALSAVQLERFAFKALTTWGSLEDLKHFLPRMLELLPHDLGTRVDAPILLGKLARGAWSSWPAEEVIALRRYLDALWGWLLQERSPSVGRRFERSSAHQPGNIPSPKKARQSWIRNPEPRTPYEVLVGGIPSSR